MTLIKKFQAEITFLYELNTLYKSHIYEQDEIQDQFVIQSFPSPRLVV